MEEYQEESLKQKSVALWRMIIDSFTRDILKNNPYRNFEFYSFYFKFCVCQTFNLR